MQLEQPFYISEGARGTEHGWWVIDERDGETVDFCTDMIGASVRAREMNEIHNATMPR